MHLLATFASLFALPGFNLVATEPHGGRLLSGRFPRTARPGFVYLPPAFDPHRRYPVAYLLHGMPGSPAEYPVGTGFCAFADAEIASGKMRPFIGVIPAAGTTAQYNGEWAGRWERAIVDGVVPWVDATLPAIRGSHGRVIAGLSAGGYGAVDIALRHPNLFGVVESWSGYFTPLRDGPFREAGRAQLAANDPVQLARRDRRELRSAAVRFFVSTGPAHSHWIRRGSSARFARELRRLGLPTTYRVFSSRKGEWREQLDAGLEWAFPA